ncbi:MAG: hypothetical protein QNJ41_12905 [Xenococcaceae cyanobacterium MO_188.B32]|nr:hypothetical protein [Xenococcaceae cyanobacterium MO_188.B32]
MVGYIPLPYKSKFSSTDKTSFKNSPPYRLIVFGHINTNRRLDILLEALSTFTDKNCFTLDIYGQIWDKDYINLYRILE